MKMINHQNFKKNLSVIILCGGKGKRLLPQTKKTPKPLIKINKKEILFHIIEHLKSYKLDDIILATGYKDSSFKKFQNTYGKKFKIKIVYSGVNSDILNRILKCKNYLKENILICYGDTIVDLNIDRLISFFKKDFNKISLCSYNLTSQFGLMKIDKQGNIMSFKEKPKLDYYFNIGFFLLKKDNFKYFKNFRTFQSFLENKKSTKHLKSFKHVGKHITVNTIQELHEAEKNLRKI